MSDNISGAIILLIKSNVLLIAKLKEIHLF